MSACVPMFSTFLPASAACLQPCMTSTVRYYVKLLCCFLLFHAKQQRRSLPVRHALASIRNPVVVVICLGLPVFGKMQLCFLRLGFARRTVTVTDFRAWCLPPSLLWRCRSCGAGVFDWCCGQHSTEFPRADRRP
ncbi:unnamed protein product [Durusdinium trenchii]|uniref:Secreted protein n=1 Tax=Durusdinium trenchii TaxID=1381693 RepID=A0ABP0MR70_9DINO